MSRAHWNPSAGVGMLEGAPGFGTSCYGLSSALRAGHRFPPPGTGCWGGRCSSHPSKPSCDVWGSRAWAGPISSAWVGGSAPSTAARSNPAGALGWVLGNSCHPPCPLYWWLCPGADQRRGRTSGCRQGQRNPVALEPLASARHPVPPRRDSPAWGQATHAFLFRRLALKVSGVETPRCRQPRPSPTGHRTRRLRRAPLPCPSFVLARAGERSWFNWQLCLWPGCYEKVFCLPL